MSRSGYTDDYGCDNQWDLIRWRGAVNSALTGKRGVEFLREMAAALDAMPEKRLLSHEWVHPESGEACALGVVAKARGLSETFSRLAPDDDDGPIRAADALGIAPALAREIVWINDDQEWRSVTPEQRWQSVRAWVTRQIIRAEWKAAKRAAKASGGQP